MAAGGAPDTLVYIYKIMRRRHPRNSNLRNFYSQTCIKKSFVILTPCQNKDQNQGGWDVLGVRISLYSQIVNERDHD